MYTHWNTTVHADDYGTSVRILLVSKDRRSWLAFVFPLHPECVSSDNCMLVTFIAFCDK